MSQFSYFEFKTLFPAGANGKKNLSEIRIDRSSYEQVRDSQEDKHKRKYEKYEKRDRAICFTCDLDFCKEDLTEREKKRYFSKIESLGMRQTIPKSYEADRGARCALYLSAISNGEKILRGEDEEALHFTLTEISEEFDEWVDDMGKKPRLFPCFSSKQENKEKKVDKKTKDRKRDKLAENCLISAEEDGELDAIDRECEEFFEWLNDPRFDL